MAAFDSALRAEEQRLILLPIHIAAPHAPQAKDLLAVGPKSLEQLIVQCQEELASAWVTLPARPTGELAFANETAMRQCQLFNRTTAVLESLNVRRRGVIRATYLCRDNLASATTSRTFRRRR